MFHSFKHINMLCIILSDTVVAFGAVELFDSAMKNIFRKKAEIMINIAIFAEDRLHLSIIFK